RSRARRGSEVSLRLRGARPASRRAAAPEAQGRRRQDGARRAPPPHDDREAHRRGGDRRRRGRHRLRARRALEVQGVRRHVPGRALRRRAVPGLAVPARADRRPRLRGRPRGCGRVRGAVRDVGQGVQAGRRAEAAGDRGVHLLEVLMTVQVATSDRSSDELVGQVLASRYLIEHKLGEGAMGTVYRARHVKMGRPFAVKVLHPKLLEDEKLALRFAREAELAGRLHHPNVIGVVDVGETPEGHRYMVMDFAAGGDLADLLGEAPMPPARIIHLVRQMLEGLYHAHEAGLIHRDFKPENVIVERDDHGNEVPRIVDFGISILRDGGEAADATGRLTTNGLVLGTPHYMAPEQAVADPIDHRIDLFALGIIVYEMLCGKLPFDGTGAEVARANLLLDPPLISERVPYLEVDPLLEAFARKLMAKKRNARPATAKAARELLDLIERDRPAAAVALGLPASMSQRTPAVTEPVLSQASGAMGSDADAEWAGQAPTASMRSPGASPLRAELAVAPTVFSAPRGAIDPRVPVGQHDIETSRKIPLSWE